MSVNLETETRLHLHAEQGHVIAVRGDDLLPDERAKGAVVFIGAKMSWLSREDAVKLGRFLLGAVGEIVP